MKRIPRTAALGVGLVLAGCGSGEATGLSTQSPASPNTLTVTAPSPQISLAAGRVLLRFDRRGANSPLISTYADPTDNGRASKNGGFNHGETAISTCIVPNGRFVPLVDGEYGVTPSATWFRVEGVLGSDGKPEFAPATYADVVAGSIATMQACKLA